MAYGEWVDNGTGFRMRMYLYPLFAALSQPFLKPRFLLQVLEENGYCCSAYEAGSDDEKKPDNGDWVREEPEDFTAVKGDLSDHRPLTLNADDFLRCANVPELKAANYRDFPGVISHRDGESTLHEPCLSLTASRSCAEHI